MSENHLKNLTFDKTTEEGMGNLIFKSFDSNNLEGSLLPPAKRNSGHEFRLRKFDMSKTRDSAKFVLIGIRGVGKTELIKDILYHKRDIPVGVVIDPTHECTKSYEGIIPSAFIHTEYQPELVDGLLSRYKIMRKKKDEQGSEELDMRSFIVQDCSLYDTETIKSVQQRQLFFNGRCYQILSILAIQWSMGIPPSLRANIDYVFIFGTNQMSDRRRLYEHYAGVFPTFSEFSQVMDQICVNVGDCLVIDNTVRSNKIEDMIYWYKAPIRGNNFKTCNEDVWKEKGQ